MKDSTSEIYQFYKNGHPDDLEWPKQVPDPLPVTARYRISSGPALMVKLNGVMVEKLRFPDIYEFHLNILNANIAYERGRYDLNPSIYRDVKQIASHSLKKLYFAIRLREEFVEELRLAQHYPDINGWRSKKFDPVIHRTIYGMEHTPHYREQYAAYCTEKIKVIPYQQDISELVAGMCPHWYCDFCLSLL